MTELNQGRRRRWFPLAMRETSQMTPADLTSFAARVQLSLEPA